MTSYLVAWDYNRCLLPISKEGNQVLCISLFVVGSYRASSTLSMGHKLSLWSKAYIAPKMIVLVGPWILYSFKIHLCLGGMCRVM